VARIVAFGAKPHSPGSSAVEMESYGFLNIGGKFVQGFCLSDNGEIETFRDVLAFTPKDPNVNDLLHASSPDSLYLR
jgi:hypothetical protein